jgi:CheY-like chemotaxis protein
VHVKILLVDDDRIVLMTLSSVLRRDGHEVTATVAAHDALRLVRQSLETGTAFDAVITDWLMPDMDGLDLAREIKALAPELPVVMLTGFGVVVPDDAQVDALLAKPVRANDLRLALGYPAA